MKVGESLQRIEMVSNDLGSYVYELKLKATPARPEKALYFRAGLGQSHIQVAKFLNFAKQAKADYTCKVNFQFLTKKGKCVTVQLLLWHIMLKCLVPSFTVLKGIYIVTLNNYITDRQQ